jgi:hypothetical protein
MNQIPITDVRYRMLLSIPQKHLSYTFTQVDIKRAHRIMVLWRGESIVYIFDNEYSYPQPFSNSVYMLI